MRNTFISPELAYSNERRKLFDKIGYNKNLTRSFLVKNPVNQQNETQVSSSITILNPQQQLQNQNQSMFMRKRTKADDSYYEKRVATLSKIKYKRLNYSEETQKYQNGLRKLMSLRKQKQQQSLIKEQFDISPRYQDFNSRTEANQTAADMITYDKTVASLCEQEDIRQSYQQPLNDLQSSSVNYQEENSTRTALNPVIRNKFIKKRQNQTSKKKLPKRDLYYQGSTIFDVQTEDNNSVNSRMMPIQNLQARRGQLQGSVDSRRGIVQQQQKSQINADNDELVNLKERSYLASSSSVTFRLGTYSKFNGVSYKIPTTAVISSQLNNLMHVPSIKGLPKNLLLELYYAKCKDLAINPSKDQMVRFFEIVQRNQGVKERCLNLVDMGLGDLAVEVISKIIKKNNQFSSLDLRKNCISNEGAKVLGRALQINNNLVHLNIGCNQIQAEGASFLFHSLKYNTSLISLSLANTDCYKNKNKIGTKGAISLSELLSHNQFLQILNISDTSISPEGFAYLIRGLREAVNLVSLNLSQNDIGSNPNTFAQLLTLFSPSKINKDYIALQSIEELVLTHNSLTNKNIEDLASVLKNCEKTKLCRLDLGYNKLSAKALLSIIQALRHNKKLKLTHLTMDKTQLEMGASQEQVTNYCFMMRTFSEYLRSNKSLQYLSLNLCQISNQLMNALGQGLISNERLETLLLRGNQIEEQGIDELVNSFNVNQNLKLKDQSGVNLANAIKNVESLEQVNLRDNNLGAEAGEAFLFLVKQKHNLWKLQIDMNMIKYVSLLDIEKICKRNRRNAKAMYIPEIQQEIQEFKEKKDPRNKLDDISNKINFQSKVIKAGFQTVIDEEEAVQKFIRKNHGQTLHLTKEKQTLDQVVIDLDDQLHNLDKHITALEKEQSRNLEFEYTLLDKYKDHANSQKEQIKKARLQLDKKLKVRSTDVEQEKLKTELDQIIKEQDMLKLIMENYEKEIDRRLKANGSLEQSQYNTSAYNSSNINNIESMQISMNKEKSLMIGGFKKEVEYQQKGKVSSGGYNSMNSSCIKEEKRKLRSRKSSKNKCEVKGKKNKSSKKVKIVNSLLSMNDSNYQQYKVEVQE